MSNIAYMSDYRPQQLTTSQIWCKQLDSKQLLAIFLNKASKTILVNGEDVELETDDIIHELARRED